MQRVIEQLVTDSVREILKEEGLNASAELTVDTALFGPDGLLDSMGLVSLIVLIEQQIQETEGVAIALADEKALSQRSSPYRTIGSLARYAVEELASRGRTG